MKRRTFFTTLFLFLIFFNGAILVLMMTTWNDRLQAQRERCLAEHYFIAYSLQKDMQAVEDRGGEPQSLLQDLMRPYLRLTQDKATDIALCQGGEALFVTDGAWSPALPAAVQGERMASIRQENGLYLTISGPLPSPHEDYVLAYRLDLADILASWRQLKNILFAAGSAFSGLLALCLLLLLGRLFRPLGEISAASKKLAQGGYENRLPVRGHDELAEMAQSFNQMAGEIQRQVDALRALAEQKQRFVDNFAHELRTPLTAIYGYAEYLQKAALQEEDKQAATGYILSECKRIQSLSRQLLELSALHHGAIDCQNLSIHALFQRVKDTVAIKAAKRQIELAVAVQAQWVRGNLGLLESLLINLLDNALKASESGSTVALDAYIEGNAVVFSVRDHGMGMSVEQLAHVKEAFYRADKSRSRRDGGAGLGLALCEQIVQVHGAKLELFSAPGQGTTVRAVFTTSSQLDDPFTITAPYDECTLQNRRERE